MKASAGTAKSSRTSGRARSAVRKPGPPRSQAKSVVVAVKKAPPAQPAKAAVAKVASRKPAAAAAAAAAKVAVKSETASRAAKPAAMKTAASKPAVAKPAPAEGKLVAAKAPASKPVAVQPVPAEQPENKPVAAKPAQPRSEHGEPAAAKLEIPAPTESPSVPTIEKSVPQKPAAEAEPNQSPAPSSEAEPESTQAQAAAPPRPGEPGRRPPGMPPGPPVLTPRMPAKAEVFHEGDHVVYPTHGVGKVERIAVEEIAGHKLELIHITFEENRMTLRVPVAKARSAGLRKLATRKMFDEAMNVLKGKARIKRTMWSRRAQEYEAKINSGDPLAIAEVVRDLHRNAGQPDQSFSERQIYEAAMDRLAAELAALDKTDKTTASTKLNDFLKTIA